MSNIGERGGHAHRAADSALRFYQQKLHPTGLFPTLTPGYGDAISALTEGRTNSSSQLIREALRTGDMATLKNIVPVLYWIAGLEVKDFSPDEQIPPGWRVIKTTQYLQLAIREAQLPAYHVSVTQEGVRVQNTADIPLTQTMKTAAPTVAGAFRRTIGHAAEIVVAPLLTANTKQLSDDRKLVDIKDEGNNRGTATLITTEREPSGWIGESKKETSKQVRIVKSRHAGWQLDTNTYTMETDGRGVPRFRNFKQTGKSGKYKVGTAEITMKGDQGWNYKERVQVIEKSRGCYEKWDGSKSVDDDFGPRELVAGLIMLGRNSVSNHIRQKWEGFNRPTEEFTDFSLPGVSYVTVTEPYKYGPLSRLQNPNADFGWTFIKYEGDNTVYGINFLELQRTGKIDQYNRANGTTEIEQLRNAGLNKSPFYRTEQS